MPSWVTLAVWSPSGIVSTAKQSGIAGVILEYNTVSGISLVRGEGLHEGNKKEEEEEVEEVEDVSRNVEGGQQGGTGTVKQRAQVKITGNIIIHHILSISQLNCHCPAWYIEGYGHTH